jgi:hypothetical protein
MAYPTVQIKTIPLWENAVAGNLGTGGTILSDAIDLRDTVTMGRYAMSYVIKPRPTNGTAGGLASCGSASFKYLAGITRDGTFFPESPTYGTSLEGGSGGTGLWEFSPRLTPWMKIQGIFGTSGGVSVTAHLNIQ